MRCKVGLSVILLTVAISLSGCMESEQEIFLNADGSGKSVMSIKYSAFAAAQFSSYGRNSGENDYIKQQIQRMVDDEDVLAWKDISYGNTEDGGFFLKATAYFKNLEDIPNLASDGGPMGTENWILEKIEDGKLVLKEKVPGDTVVRNNNSDPNNKPKLTDEQLDFKVKQLKSQLAQTQPMMQMYLKDFKYKLTIHLPGDIEEANGITKINDNKVMMELSGDKMIKSFDQFIADANNLREMAKGPEDVMSGFGESEFMRKALLGIENPVSVKFMPVPEMSIDYSGEIKIAKDNFKSMTEKLGLEYVEPVVVEIDPNDVPVITNVEVIGAELMRKIAKKENDSRQKGYYGNQKPEYKMFFCADLSCPVSDVKNVELISVKDDTGKELLTQQNNYSYVEYFSSDKTRASFQADMNVPSENAKSIASVEGELICVAMSHLETKELGVVELKDGYCSDNNAVKVESISKTEVQYVTEDSSYGRVTLSTHTPGYKILTIKLLDEQGREIKAYEPCGVESNFDMNSGRITLEFEEPIPSVVQVEVEMTRHFAEYTLPFKIGNIDFMGKPLGK